MSALHVPVVQDGTASVVGVVPGVVVGAGHGADTGAPPWYGSGYHSTTGPNGKFGKNKGNSEKP